jgi:hypothetical protein
MHRGIIPWRMTACMGKMQLSSFELEKGIVCTPRNRGLCDERTGVN